METSVVVDPKNGPDEGLRVHVWGEFGVCLRAEDVGQGSD